MILGNSGQKQQWKQQQKQVGSAWFGDKIELYLKFGIISPSLYSLILGTPMFSGIKALICRHVDMNLVCVPFSVGSSANYIFGIIFPCLENLFKNWHLLS